MHFQIVTRKEVTKCDLIAKGSELGRLQDMGFNIIPIGSKTPECPRCTPTLIKVLSYNGTQLYDSTAFSNFSSHDSALSICRDTIKEIEHIIDDYRRNRPIYTALAVSFSGRRDKCQKNAIR